MKRPAGRRDGVTVLSFSAMRTRPSRGRGVCANGRVFGRLFLLGVCVSVFVSCEPDVVFFTDPYFQAIHGSDAGRELFSQSPVPISRPFLSRVVESPDDVYRLVSEYLIDTTVSKVVLSPLYSFAGERIAAAHPDRTVFSLGRSDLADIVAPALFDRSRALEEAGQLVAETVRDEEAPGVALFVVETERDEHEMEAFLRGAARIAVTSLSVVRESRLPARDRARQLARDAIAEDPGIVAVFLGHAGVYALELLAESGRRVVSENVDASLFPNVYATVESVYPDLFDAIRAASGRSAVVVEARLVIHE
ncbi:MAG: hypothetical protein EA426_07190 [Spirochaetaceae bacterium]|nr:MAG: hypothetical protein EA426_07190 [Spirochaetaceae bacterium]